jgi:hypothetical protein
MKRPPNTEHNHRTKQIDLGRPPSSAAMGRVMPGELPIGFRVSWLLQSTRPFDEEFRAKAVAEDFPAWGEAEARQLALFALYGRRVAVCITAIYPNKAAREKRLKSRQLMLPCPLPLQKKPPST